jgi:large subunit ribosomal protein L23
MDSNTIIKYPLSTEKAIRLMESENKLVFTVDRGAQKPDIKKAVETLFKVKVMSVNTVITTKGEKHAYVRLADETPAIDVATKLGMM